MSHTPGPWVWMDESEEVPGKRNDGSKGVGWLGPANDGINCEESYVLHVAAECDDWPEEHPYRKRFHHKTTEGGIAVLNVDDLPLIAAAPELLEALQSIYHDLAMAPEPGLLPDDRIEDVLRQALCECREAALAAIAKTEGTQ